MLVAASLVGGCGEFFRTVDAGVARDDAGSDRHDAGGDPSVDAGPVLGPPPAWTQITPATSPPGRSDLAMTFDSARGRVVMFGGEALASLAGSTWEYDGANWSEVTGAGAPAGRWGHAMAYDAARGRVVLFGGGGTSTSTSLRDTWEYDGATWRAMTPTASPPARARHAMAYDAARHRVVLFSGGSISTTEFQAPDTWEYDGVTWTRVTPPTSPPGRSDHSMIYDSTRHRIVLFGGQRDTFERRDTWEYDGTTWREVVTAAAPPGRATMAYDAARGRAVAFGDSIAGSTWEYDGVFWVDRMLTPAPSARFRPAMAYDSTRGRVVFFGGMVSPPQAYPDDTWELGPADPP